MSQEAVEIGDITLIPDRDRIIVEISTQESWSCWSTEGARLAISVLQAWVDRQE